MITSAKFAQVNMYIKTKKLTHSDTVMLALSYLNLKFSVLLACISVQLSPTQQVRTSVRQGLEMYHLDTLSV